MSARGIGHGPPARWPPWSLGQHAGARVDRQAQEATLGSNVQGLLAYARAQSPELEAMRREADAAAQRVGPAGALPDPVLRVELMNINNYGNDARRACCRRVSARPSTR